MRFPRAADVLVRQVREKHKRATMKAEGEADGFGVYRTVRFDKTSSKWLDKILPEIDDDRIIGFTKNEDGSVSVLFSHRTIADRRDSFPLDEADLVAGD